MSYCLNPDCQKPEKNSANSKFCQNCGSKLLLKDRYRPIKLIGQGGFGKTFLALDEDKPSKPRCVIKQFFPQAQGTNNAQKAAELFEQEAVRLDDLGKHPQIPELLAHSTQDNRQYLVQEFIDGQNLAQLLSAEGAFTEPQIRDLLSSLLPVLQFIHSRKVIHRDIKPENIIRRPNGQLVLVDFGAAKYATATSLAQTGTTIGSAGYAAPEQSFGKAVFASDIYGLGVSCIHLLTNVEPFDLYDANENSLVWRHYLVNNPVTDALGSVLDKMIQSVASKRYQSAQEVVQDLGILGKVARSPQKQIDDSKIHCENFSLITTLSGADSAISSIAISPDGQQMVSGSGAIRTPYSGIIFRVFPVLKQDNSIKIWQLDSGKLIHTLQGHSKTVGLLAFSPDGQTLVSVSDNTIKLWDVGSGQEKMTSQVLLNCIHSFAFSPVSPVSPKEMGDTLAIACQDKTIRLWNIRTGQEKRTLGKHSSLVRSLAFSPDGQLLACGCQGKIIQLWEVNTGNRKGTLGGWFSKHANWVSTMAFSPDGQLLASGSRDKTIKLWDVVTRKEKRTLRGHSNWVNSVAFSPDGRTLASASWDKTIKLWDVSTGQQLCHLRGHTDGVLSVAFSPDQSTLVSGSADRTIKIWRCN